MQDFFTSQKCLSSPGNGWKARKEWQVLKNSLQKASKWVSKGTLCLLPDLEFKPLPCDTIFFQQMYLKCTNMESLDSFLHKFDFSTLIIVYIVHHLGVITLYLSIPKLIQINLVT